MHSSQKQSFVALVGAPNSGKTTLYNWLTGSKFKTVNYPGATVEYSLGLLAVHHGEIPFLVMDTPGTYSLFPKSVDEEVTVNAIFSHPQFGAAEKVIVVVDATQLSRHLLMAEQLKCAGFSVVVALTMADLLRKSKIEVDLQYLSSVFKCPVVPIDGLLGGGIQDLIATVKSLPASGQPRPYERWDLVHTEKVQKQIDNIVSQSVLSNQKQKAKESVMAMTLKIDRILLHPVLGLFIFAAIMMLLFSSIFWMASPFMDMVSSAFTWLSAQTIKLMGPNLLSDFLANGVIASFGAILVFVPQIFILFFGIGILESTGYLARAATLIDKPFSRLGMSGRSFVPILSGFACAVPAIMATRNIGSNRDRWITNFVIPLMTCSARLPVYSLLLSFLFIGHPLKAGIALSAIYIFSLFIGAIAAGILNKIIKKNNETLFMMELPLYRRPRFRILLKQCLHRTQAYVRRAGPVIFVLAVIIWVGTTFPHYELENANEKLQQSYLAQMGHAVEPVFKPMGVDWRVGVGLASAFAAREVFVATTALLFNVTEDEEGARNESLLKQMQTAKFSDGTPIFTLASVAGLILFFMIALQCMSTVSVTQRETNSWKFALGQLVGFNIIAYVLTVALVQSLHLFGVG